MRKLSICERHDLRLVGAENEADAIFYLKYEIEREWPQTALLLEFKQWQVGELRDYKSSDIRQLITELDSNVRLMYGSRLFAVTVHYEVSIYVKFSPDNDSGLAGESGVPVASDSQGASKGSTEADL